jgi:hypothetical protein
MINKERIEKSRRIMNSYWAHNEVPGLEVCRRSGESARFRISGIVERA